MRTLGSAGFRWWGSCGPGVVRGYMCGYNMFRLGMTNELTSISTYHYYLWRNLVTSHLLTQL